MADYTITSPRLQVLRGQLDAPEVIEVQTLNPDLIAWDMTRAKHRWPEVREAPFKWLTFIAWHACRREGRIPRELTYEEWEASTLNVSNLDGEGEGGAVDPTPPGLEPRLIVEIAAACELGIPPPWFWDVDDATLATVLLLLGEKSERIKKASRKRK